MESYTLYVERMRAIFPDTKFRSWEELPKEIQDAWLKLYHN